MYHFRTLHRLLQTSNLYSSTMKSTIALLVAMTVLSSVCYCCHIIYMTKWSQFHRRYFQMHLREWKVLSFDNNFTEVCSLGSNWQLPSIGLNNGLAPKRRQAIIWTSADPIEWNVAAIIYDQYANRTTPWNLPLHFLLPWLASARYVIAVISI